MSTRLPLLPLTALTAGALLLGSCGGDGGDDLAWDAQSVGESLQDVPVTPVMQNSMLGPGVNRLVLALFDDEAQPVGDASVSARFFRLAADPEQEPRAAEEADVLDLTPRTIAPSTDHVHDDGTVHKHEGDPVTVFVGVQEFDRPGHWGAQLEIELDGERYTPRITFFVQERTSEPAVGDPAPRSEQLTTRDAPIEDVDTANPPNPALHDTTIEEAVTGGRPSVIAFVTPAFCESRFCGPVLDEVVLPAWEQYRDRVTFVHVEPYDLPKMREGQRTPVAAFLEWGLVSEPYVFVVDAEGMVAAKFEGIMEPEELIAAIEQVLQETPSAASP